MSRRIFRDIEEAISREVRRITFHEDITASDTVLQQLFDPFSGELISAPIEADYYDSSADTSGRQYPHFFVRLMKVREDLYSNRVNGQQWGNQFPCPNEELGVPVSAPKAYEHVLPMSVGNISSVGDDLTFSSFKARRVQAGHLLRVLDGNNKGTYTIDSVTIGDPSTITVTKDLLEDLPAFLFDSDTRIITFQESIDLTTIKVGDTFTDNSSNAFSITAINNDSVQLTIDGAIVPDTDSGSVISRSGDVFQTVDPDPICFVVLDPTKPITNRNGNQVISGSQNVNGAIPLDIFYMVRIDSKERATHIEVLNRMWEEFNPPRTSLPTIVRSKDSAETLLTADATGTDTITVASNSDINVNDKVFIINDFNPSKSDAGGFEEPFEATVVEKSGTDTLVFDKIIPDTFLVSDCAKVVSNADYKLLFFHFVDHATKDVEGAQYWVHEFSFWVQANVDRQGEPAEFEGNVGKVSTPIEDIDGVEIISDL